MRAPEWLTPELGAGGMAVVYLAEDLRFWREVAIEVLHPQLSAVLGPERFLAEIKLTAALQHPHILPLLDSGSADGLLFYVIPSTSFRSPTRCASPAKSPMRWHTRTRTESSTATWRTRVRGWSSRRPPGGGRRAPARPRSAGLRPPRGAAAGLVHSRTVALQPRPDESR